MNLVLTPTREYQAPSDPERKRRAVEVIRQYVTDPKQFEMAIEMLDLKDYLN